MGLGLVLILGLIVCSKIEDGMPIFSQISDIIVFAGIYFLDVEHFETLGFDEHFHYYHVVKGNEFDVSLLRVDQLQFFQPFDLQTTYTFDRNVLYVVLVHVLL